MTEHTKNFSQDETRKIILNKVFNIIDDETSKTSDDNVFHGIKVICNKHLENRKIEIEESAVNYALEFLVEKYDFYNNFRETLELHTYSNPFLEFELSVDEYMLTGDKNACVHEVVYGKMSKDCYSILEQLKFCHGIMVQIKKSLKQ